MSAPVDELVLDGPDDGPPGAEPASPPPGRPGRRRRAVTVGAAVAALLFAAWSGHAAGRLQGRGEGATTALEQARLLVWFTGEGEPDGEGRASFELFAAAGSGRPLTVRAVHVGADTLTPVRPLVVPAGTSASTTARADVVCGSARELELMRSAPNADRVGTLTADVVDPDGAVREVPVGLLPDGSAFRTLLRLAACRTRSEDLGGIADPTRGLRIAAMTAMTDGTLQLRVEAGDQALPATVAVIANGGAYWVTATPPTPVAVVPGGPPALISLRVEPGRCPAAPGGLPSAEGAFALEVSTTGLVSRARLPGWDQAAVGQAAAVGTRHRCG